MKKIMLTMLCVLTLSSTYAKAIRFATEATYPPFEYTDASGNIKGFDIDIAKAICQQMHVQCTFSNQSFSGLIPSLQLGKYDALIAAIGVTEERKKQVDFTNAYYEPRASFVAGLSNQYSIRHLDGKTIGVQQGSTLENYLRDKFGNKIIMKSYGSVQDAFLDLESGRLDLVVADSPIAQAWLKQSNNKFSVVDKPIIDHYYFGNGFAIAVNKKNSAILIALNKALAEIKANGTYAKILHEYFGER